MTVPRLSSDTPALWAFASALYGASGVAECAIMLQDRHGVDVNIMLFICWLAGFGSGMVAAADIDAARRAAAPLREGTIHPLRARRRAIPKGGEREAERQALLERELAAEKAELALLEGLAPDLGPSLADGAVIEAAAMAGLRLYVQAAGQPVEAALAHLARKAAAVHLGGR